MTVMSLEKSPTAAYPRPLMVLKRTGGRGGLQLQARRVTRHMARMGVPVRMLGHQRGTPRKVPSWHRGVPIRHIQAGGQWSFAVGLYRWLLAHRDEYDVVHVHGFGIDTFTAIAAKRVTGKPLIVKPSTAGKGTKLHVYAHWTRRLPLLRPLAWERVDAWVSISDQTRADLELMGIQTGRIVDTPNGVNLRRFHPLNPDARAEMRAKFGLAPDDRVIMSVARLTDHKRVDAVIRAFQELVQEMPQLRLWVVGTGERCKDLHELARNGPGADRVQFFEQVPPHAVARRMQAADLFTLLSRWEGLSNALLEAMATALPPVVTDVSGMTDVVKHRESGLVVPLDDHAVTVATLRELLTDADLSSRLGKAARATINARYALGNTVARLLELYDRCLTLDTGSVRSSVADGSPMEEAA